MEPLTDEEIHRKFDEIDKNNSGVLDAAELGAALQQLGLRADCTQELIARVKTAHSESPSYPESGDHNRPPRTWRQKHETPLRPQPFVSPAVPVQKSDAHVTFAEFYSFVRLRESELRESFRAIDTNNNGVLELSEVCNALKSLGLSFTENEVRKLVSRPDINQDGVVSFDEFRHLALLFPSVATKQLFNAWGEVASVDIGETSYTLPPERVNSPIVTIVAGGVAGAVSRTVTAPADRLKVVLQAGGGSLSGQVSIVQGMKTLYAEAGLRGLFRGNGTNVLKIVPESSLKLFTFEFAKSKLAADPDHVTVPERLLSGSFAGAVAQAAIYPMEITKTRLAVAPAGTYKGIADCITTTIREEGPASLYRGLVPSLCGIIPYAGVDLGMYSFLRDRWMSKHPNEDPNVRVLLTCGALSSICGQCVAYPLQLVRTRLQAQGSPGRPVVYSGMMDCFRQVLAAEGVRGLYRGIMPNFLKAVPAISISYAVYEKTKQLLNH